MSDGVTYPAAGTVGGPVGAPAGVPIGAIDPTAYGRRTRIKCLV